MFFTDSYLEKGEEIAHGQNAQFDFRVIDLH
jgi:hypothetical protein